jgi:uncharacterized NAD(P)/FAD-binding protein YdhS
MAQQARQVLVVGGGAAGVIASTTLLRNAGSGGTPVDVTLVERARSVGPGLAYGTDDDSLLLNNYVCRMSAIEDDPDHLRRWCLAQGLAVTGDTFLPRSTYGRYLAELLRTVPVPSGSGLRTLHDEVVDVVDAGSTYLATTASGAVLTADVVVLALGNPPPRRERGLDLLGRRLVGDPWAPDLLDRVSGDAHVLLVGTGLTTVDVAARIAAAHPRVRLTAASRTALLPLRHEPTAPSCEPSFDTGVRTLRDLLREVRRCAAAGVEWRCVVESVKAVANDVWRALPQQDKEQFVRHVGRRWETARHRMAPAMASVVDSLVAEGRLEVRRWPEVEPTAYDVVVTCTGPAPVCTPGWNPLVDGLAVKGMLWPGPLGLGVDVDEDGALVDAAGVSARGIHVLGAGRRGAEWEVAAVPDLRRQAARLAARLAGRLDLADGPALAREAVQLVG